MSETMHSSVCLKNEPQCACLTCRKDAVHSGNGDWCCTRMAHMNCCCPISKFGENSCPDYEPEAQK